MDLHNNQVGRALATGAATADDCENLVREALLEGTLRFLRTRPAPKFPDCDCRPYDSRLPD